MEATLVYPHQLFDPHPAVCKGRVVYVIEEPLLFGTDPKWPMPAHKQKLVLVLHMASMSTYAAELEKNGIEVMRVKVSRGVGSGVMLEKAIPMKITELHVADIVDDLLGRRIRKFAEGRGITLVVHESPNFLTPQDFLERHIGRMKKPFMARFYEAQRKRMGILLDEDGGPVGGRWSFDEDNRKKWPKNVVPPAEPRAPRNGFVEDAVCRVEREFHGNPGTTEGFRWLLWKGSSVK